MKICKKILFVLASLFLSWGFFTTTVLAAETSNVQEEALEEEETFEYVISNKAAVITAVNLSEGQTSITVPKTLDDFPVKEISSYLFMNSKLEEITLPDSIEVINSGAFSYCNKLKKIHLPDKLSYLGDGAFASCKKLRTVNLGNKITKIGKTTFYNCTSLTHIVIPDSVESIEDSAFYGCFRLHKVKFGKSVSYIGNYAFAQNYALKSIIIPASVKNMGGYVFDQCDSLASVKILGKDTGLGNGVFYKCSALKKVKLPQNIKIIPESTFYGCSSLKKIKIPEKVAVIKKRAFSYCSNLKKVKLNEKVYALGNGAFSYSGISKLKLNDNMQFIGNSAFRSTQLKKLVLPGKVTYIGNRLFANCQKLRKIYIPASVKGINLGAFNHCISLESITVSEDNEKYSSENGILYNKPKTKMYQYPLQKKNQVFVTPTNLRRVRAHAFMENPYLQEVVVYGRVIGKRSFENMQSLRKVTVMNGAKEIRPGAFRNCPNLSEIILPNSVSTIRDVAFANTAIKEFTVPSSLKVMPMNVFDGCEKLRAFQGSFSPSFRVENGVLYNRSKTELIKYPPKKRDKSFTVPNCVKKVRTGAFYKVKWLRDLYLGSGFRTLQYHAIYQAKRLRSVVFGTKKLSYVSYYGISSCKKLAVIVGPRYYSMRNLAQTTGATLIII